MKLRKILWIALLAIMTMALAACGGDGDDNGGGDSAELSQTASYEDTDAGFTITANYPEGWASTTDGGITLANSADILDLVNDPNTMPTSDQVGGGLIVFDTATLEFLNVAADASVSDAVSAFGALNAEEDASFEMGEVSETEINGTTVASATATGPIGDTGETADFLILAISVDGGMVFGSFASGSGGIGDFVDTIRAIVASAEVTGLSAE